MPALPPYIPPKDAAFDNWLANFSSLISASPATYGLTAGDAANIANARSTWAIAYAFVTSPSTKTSQAVQNKNTARVTALAVVRSYAQQISLNAGVTSANKIALGVNPRTSTPSPVTAPVSNPVLTVQSASNLAIILRFRDSAASPSVKAKPYGVFHCQVDYLVSATPITDPTMLTNTLLATKTPLTVKFNPADAGKQCYFVARWTTRSGLYSPWSPIASFTVPAGG